jgi:hypothetical protein
MSIKSKQKEIKRRKRQIKRFNELENHIYEKGQSFLKENRGCILCGDNVAAMGSIFEKEEKIIYGLCKKHWNPTPKMMAEINNKLIPDSKLTADDFKVIECDGFTYVSRKRNDDERL